MYRDQITGELSKPSQKSAKIVTKTRPKQYFGERENKETKRMESVVIGEGFEIVEEKTVLPETAVKFNQGELLGKTPEPQTKRILKR